ncbi:hypothetical protein HHI36_012362 [Cryptolaemus montrouzieri]|uniref:Uncharacterized protein n=1 Tax=Cryptolaemus montrouzieri TaxID=559131 RepID=A0ABD2NEQ9_9CUCU
MKKNYSLLRKNYSLIPLFLIVGTGITAAVAFGTRVALYHPEVNWRREGHRFRDYEKHPYRKLWWYFENPMETSQDPPTSIH